MLLLRASKKSDPCAPYQAVWRYVPGMKNVSIVLLVFLVVLGAVAQPEARRKNEGFGTTHEQQRAQLRSELRAPHESESQETEQAPDHVLRQSTNRHLSAQERSDLRNQLQQTRDAKDAGAPARQK